MKFKLQPKNVPSILIALSLLCFALLPKTQASPETALTGFNTADGQNALGSLTTGVANAAFGWFSLSANTDGSFNTGVGAGTLLFNVGDQAGGEGVENTAVGAVALLFNTTGTRNNAVGASALLNNDSGSFNNAHGGDTLTSNVDGDNNNAFGDSALASNVSGSRNNALGSFALSSHQTGDFNNAVGTLALSSDESGLSNNAFGDEALSANVSGVNNTAMGDFALVGSTGDGNTALGYQAGAANESGSNNIYIGDAGGTDESNVIAIGAAPVGDTYTTTYIGGIYDAVVADRQVYVDSIGHIGTLASSRRYKEEIKPMDKASEALFALKPVTFRYKQEIDRGHRLSFGLIAEDVAEISADLVSRDKEGKTQTVRYEAVDAMLLNEFLKEHKKVEAQQATIAELKSTVGVLTAQLKEQAAQIQKVSAQIELKNPAPQTVVNK